MNYFLLSSLAVIAFTALIHASFQLSVSVLTLVSGHSLGRKAAHERTLRLMSGVITGVTITTLLILCTVVYCLTLAVQQSAQAEPLIASIVCGLLAGLGIATWAFYYRKGPGTSLWLPRSTAHFLVSRAKTTKHSTEAFGIGMVSVIAEFIFIIAPILAAGLVIATLPTASLQIAGIITYLILSIAPLVVVFVLVGSGHKITKIQLWRERNKRFLQFASGGSLIIVAAFLFVERVLGLTMHGMW